MCVPQLFLRREQQVDKQFKVDETATPPATGICVLCSSICVRMLLYKFKADETATPPATPATPATGICVICSYMCVRMLLYKLYVSMCPHTTIYVLRVPMYVSASYYIHIYTHIYMAMVYAGLPTDPSDVC